MSAPDLHVEALGPADWRANKALRLEALRLEPAAFSSTYEDSLAQPDGWWQERLANPRCTSFMARSGKQPVGMVAACLGEDEPEVGFIFGMYVNARFRRQGVGRQLLQAALAHLAAQPGVVTIRLWVRETHHPARRLYESLGFRPAETPAGPGSAGEVEMERPAWP